MKNLNVKRVVFSGGEPLLSPVFEDLLQYYNNNNINEIITLTNGLLLNQIRLKRYISLGLTGVTFSLDGLSELVAHKTRGLSSIQHKKVVSNLIHLIDSTSKIDFEIGLNVVISSANILGEEIYDILEFGETHQIDWIKFQPVFNDGYVQNNAPELILNPSHSNRLREIGNKIQQYDIKSNPQYFWDDLADILEGRKIKGSNCGIDDRIAISIRGDVKFCFWVNFPIYGKSKENISIQTVEQQRKKFLNIKSKCSTGIYCFCLQDINHKW